jgi:iron complex transport system substrate-binding protein
MKLVKFFILIFSFFFIWACKQAEKKPISVTNTTIKYAKGFTIQSFKDYKKLIIKAPYPNATETFEVVLLPKGNNLPKEVKGAKIIATPIEKIVVTSTTHIPMLELLHQEQSLVGFPNTKYISSKRTRQRIADGAVKELGNEQDINIEVLLNLQPEAVIGFAINSDNKMFANIEKTGIPVLLNGDWLEETPLGRAEWIKFFGALFNKEKEADSIFNAIERQYKEAELIAKKATNSPTVLSGALFKDVWNLPAGDSFVAQFLKDANTRYLWADTNGKGSLSLNFESVLDKGKSAEFWIAPGYYTSLSQLKNANEHYTQFEAFQHQNIYSFANKTGENGGVLYYELAPVQPHIVLKDIIKAVHPELLPEYQPFFLEKLK